eukprot:GGOE01010001.1.p1 GENE.GGOE01010001.1~~GGOE01010001.1.p1  ORF type:complete len:223 (-),score=9.07 GGOE01010001.1:110-778(-)
MWLFASVFQGYPPLPRPSLHTGTICVTCTDPSLPPPAPFTPSFAPLSASHGRCEPGAKGWAEAQISDNSGLGAPQRRRANLCMPLHPRRLPLRHPRSCRRRIPAIPSPRPQLLLFSTRTIHVYPPKMYQSHSGTVPLRRFALAVPLQSSTMLSVVLLLSTLGTLRYPISALTRPLHCNHHTHRSQLAEAPPLLFPNKKVIFAHLQTSTPTPHITHRVGTTLV